MMLKIPRGFFSFFLADETVKVACFVLLLSAQIRCLSEVEVLQPRIRPMNSGPADCEMWTLSVRLCFGQAPTFYMEPKTLMEQYGVSQVICGTECFVVRSL
jgi:hypothetical protein